MRSRMMIGVGVALALTACEQTEVREITEDRYLPQPMDTVKITDNYYLDGYISRGAEDIGEGRTLQAVNLFLDGDELYVANFAERCVDVFDVKRLTYKRSISNGERTFVRDIYVEDGHLFVAAGDSREVQVFDKHSGTYLTRLGTGIWPVSNVSWAGCVAATKNFVFVRDSKETNVRVFDRKAVLLTAVNNNTVFAKLGTGSDFIGSSTEPHGESYDMEVIGDSLYAFIPRSGTIYAWNIHEIADKKNDTPTSVTWSSGVKICSVAKGRNDSLLFVAMVKDGKTQLAEIALSDFQSRNFDRPLRLFVSDSRVRLSPQPIVTYLEERIILPNGDKLECWEIRKNPSFVILPTR